MLKEGIELLKVKKEDVEDEIIAKSFEVASFVFSSVLSMSVDSGIFDLGKQMIEHIVKAAKVSQLK